MQDEAFEISVSSHELYVLASLLGGDMIIGVPDPFPGWLREEIDAALEQAQGRLIEHQYLQRHSEDQIVIDLVAAGLVGTMIEPQRVLLLSLTHAENSTSLWTAYHRPPLTTWLEGNSHGEWRLQAIDPETLPERVAQIWNLKEQKPPPGGSVMIPQDAIQAVRAARYECETALFQLLHHYGAIGENARALAHTLATARQNGALTLLIRQGKGWSMEGLGILEGENGLWLLRQEGPSDHPLVICQPSTAEAVLKEVHILLQQSGWLEVD